MGLYQPQIGCRGYIKPTVMSGLETALHMADPEVGNRLYSQIATKQKGHLQLRQAPLTDNPRRVGKTVSQLHEADHLLLLAIKRNAM